MAIQDSRQLYKSGFNEKDVCCLSEQQIERLRKILLEMLSDFLKMAKQHDLHYTLSGGSVLGAVRHHGFIPWDDDIDINLTRAEYNRLLTFFDESMGEKYILCTPEHTENHGILCAQIKKRGTIYRSFNELSKTDEMSGVCIDVFVVENVPNNRVLRTLHGCLALAMGYLSTCRKTYEDFPYIRNYLEADSPAAKAFAKKARIGKWFRWISLDAVTRAAAKCYSLCKNSASTYVTIPSGRGHFFKEMQLRTDLCESDEVEFEQLTVRIPRGFDPYLKSLYGEDYMTPPPPEQRECHPLMQVDFGE